jgi:hypothetical protein
MWRHIKSAPKDSKPDLFLTAGTRESGPPFECSSLRRLPFEILLSSQNVRGAPLSRHSNPSKLQAYGKVSGAFIWLDAEFDKDMDKEKDWATS